MRLGRNIIVKSFANSIIDKTLMDPDLKVKLHIIKTRGSYPYYYFTESDVVSLVDKQLQKGYLPILFWGAYNTIRRSLVEYLILELEHKHFIERTSNNDLQEVSFEPRDNDDFTAQLRLLERWHKNPFHRYWRRTDPMQRIPSPWRCANIYHCSSTVMTYKNW